MCLAIPMQVTAVTEDGIARCQVGASQTFVNASAALLEEDLHPGDFVIVHAGFAIRKLDPKEAEETLRILREMAELAIAEGLL